MNILVLGNGFDLAHDLPTKYSDFLEFIDIIREIVINNKDINNIDWSKINPKLIPIIKAETGNKAYNLYNKEYEWRELIEDNCWIEYFQSNSMYQKENWIDFESEIAQIIQSIDNDMDGDLETEVHNLSNDFLRNKYGTDVVAQYIGQSIKPSITFRELRDKLVVNLNNLIKALERYLYDYVRKIEIDSRLPEIESITPPPNKVLSFNYTDTYERVYGEKIETEYNYIHGKASDGITLDNNMVLGIDEYLDDDRKNKDVEFIAFKKYYQRIHRETGCAYKDWIQPIKNSEKYDGIEYIKYNIYIFGHSLDVTDKDILRELILNDNTQVKIFYHNKDIYGKQIANLVKVIGQDNLIKKTGGSTKTIEFIAQNKK